MKTAYATVLGLALALPMLSLAGDADAAGKQRSLRGQLVHQIVMKWGNHVQESYRTDVRQWTGAMAPVFAKASIDTLSRAANATTFDAMNDVLISNGNAPSTQLAAGKSPITARSLGDAAADLVYVPISPCRILDTRVAGGQIAAGTTRGIDVTAVSDYSFQGGSASNCNGAGAAGSFAAAAINFTIVSPVGGPGHMTAFPFGTTMPTSSSLNFNSGDVKGNLGIFSLDQGASANELSVYVTHTTHLVGDIVGYFINPQATALQCVEVDGTPLNLAAGAAGNAFAGACTAGYTAVETQCRPSIFGMRVAGSWTSHCNMVNDSASAGTVTATARCCRVPGR